MIYYVIQVIPEPNRANEHNCTKKVSNLLHSTSLKLQEF